jgi:hypothetical protein
MEHGGLLLCSQEPGMDHDKMNQVQITAPNFHLPSQTWEAHIMITRLSVYSQGRQPCRQIRHTI